MMKTLLIGIAMICAVPATAMAFQCPSLQAQIDKAVGNRFDAGAAGVRQMAAKGAALHKSGKHAESVKAYQDAAKAGNIKLAEKK